MKPELIEVSKRLLTNCLGLKAGETFLVVADDSREELAKHVYEAGRRLGAESVIMVMKEREKSGQEPPVPVASAMAASHVVICLTKMSLTHTQARKQAVAAGSRLATMPSITEDMFLQGAVAADYSEVKVFTEKVTDMLTTSKQARIEKDGYSLTFSLEERKGVPSTGVYLNPGESVNLPSGEAYIAPVEGTANGQLLVDGSIAEIGKVQGPVLLTIEDGRLVKAEGPDGEQLLHILGDGDGRSVAEFGIGTNKKARITGVVLEDEKVYGTVHVAFGSNNTFGGIVSAGVHIDCVVKQQDVYLDGNKVMEKGQLIC
ncbi:aminopeptidase [Paenibacillus larvae]|uniref:Leucyl aminopeptidase n=1 Tax=Paenibacillus larvae subsp. larvae DSM 25430 TaxID=697284 RepID=V9WB50_9BACL|nr:aminopeptidase [Paenibacillus larvae]AHD07109.1 leucyl aminopeptidase [Paenibacillus larvae subsp. larvae DSM 25430]AVG13672.1 leucyl aminopeptidase [Paenibacillus larvae subsp. larvae DSM 25430]MDR5568369.1 aminopeptidase [Paenibacillus larvae]MDR5597347.1 aminopeptidase [Paenibacillus larvae]